MFREYILEEAKPDFKRAKKRLKPVSEDVNDPCVALRHYGIAIKKSVPHKQGYEISLFVDPDTLPLEKILKGFDFTVKDGKIYVKFREM